MDLTGLVNKYKNKSVNIVVIILALIIASNIYSKQAKELESLKGKKDIEIKKNSVLDNIGQLEKKINSYKNLLAKKDASLVISTMSNLARESKIKILSIKPGPEKRYTDYLKFPFDLTVSAPDYHALGRFISRVENYQDVYVVESVDIKSEEQKKELSVNLKVSSIAFAPLDNSL